MGEKNSATSLRSGKNRPRERKKQIKKNASLSLGKKERVRRRKPEGGKPEKDLEREGRTESLGPTSMKEGKKYILDSGKRKRGGKVRHVEKLGEDAMSFPQGEKREGPHTEGKEKFGERRDTKVQ